MTRKQVWTQKRYEAFVKIWQNASDVQEVAETFGISITYASNIASQLRAQGVPLKKFATKRGRNNKTDYAALKRIAKEW